MAGIESMICSSCSKCTGKLQPAWEFLTKIKLEKALRERKDLNPDMYDSTSEMTDFEDILNFLKLKKRTCDRTRMLTSSKLRGLADAYTPSS